MESSSTIDDYLWPNKYLLMIQGFWPMDPGENSIASRLFIYCRITLSLIAVSSIFVPEVLMLIVFWGDLAILTGVGCVALTVGQNFFKMLYILAHGRSFSRIYFITRKLWSMTANDKLERQDLEKVAGWAKRFTTGFFLLCISNNLSFTTTAIVFLIHEKAEKNETFQERNLPFPVWYGFDFKRTPYFEIAFGIQYVSGLCCCIGIVGFDTTMMSLILHVCGHFRVIGARLRAIGRRMQEDESYLKSDHVDVEVSASKDIGRVIEYHRLMLSIAEEIRALLSPIIFVQLLTSGLVICLSGYVVIVNSNGRIGADLIRWIVNMMTMFTQLVLWCWPGELLIHDSQNLGDVACHELPWYMMTNEQQRDLVLFIMRTQKECRITALGFQVMSMSKFTEVFNTAGSYLALLRTIYGKQMEEQ